MQATHNLTQKPSKTQKHSTTSPRNIVLHLICPSSWSPTANQTGSHFRLDFHHHSLIKHPPTGGIQQFADAKEKGQVEQSSQLLEKETANSLLNVTSATK